MTVLILSIGLGYLFGNIQTAYFLGKWTRKIDIRDYGTTNAGASNITITLGLGYGIVTFLVDAAKGFLAVFLVQYYWTTEPTMALLAGIFAILGHIYPFCLGFRGGKGVATLYGVLLAADWRIGLLAFGIQSVITLVSNYVAVGSIAVFILLPLISYHFDPSLIRLGLTVAMMSLLFFQHLPNLRHIYKGEEKGFWGAILKQNNNLR
jgi:acyl phosphate:glycerol-3-phosphate acyltransferase